MHASPPTQSRAVRYAFMLVLGLLIGLVASVMVANALRARRDPVPDSLMQIMAYQLRALRPDAGATCTPMQQQRRLQSLRLLADEVEPAFPAIGEDRRFSEHAQALRAVLDQAARVTPSDCSQLGELHTRISDACEACHRDFR
ncbi:cytochrome c [Xanthomonas phaseoli]|uniref:cytochrome c n=1 Tax=Xanthomonas phaseoli TaxID=1985254 RepID=UPI00030B2D6D|nr:cytochrome c [Xanthomonas phaseoli]